jgi:hypothetical protein
VKLYLGVGLLVAVAASSWAGQREIDRAHSAIRSLIIRSSSGSNVYFTQTNERWLSTSESYVTGEGVSSGINDWAGMPFRYSIKVRRTDGHTRDSAVVFADGRRLSGNNNWGPNDPWNRDVRIDRPSWYQTINSNRVTIAGSAQGARDVRIQVFDRSGRMRFNASVRVSGGRFSTSAPLDPGTYRAVVTRGNWNEGDEVRFNMQRSSGGWGSGNNDWNWGGSGGGGWGGGSGGGNNNWNNGGGGRPPMPNPGFGLNVEYPQNGQLLNGPNVRYYGRASGNQVELITYRGGQRVQRIIVRVTNGRWSHNVRLRDGNYRLDATSAGRRQTVPFRVR